jgi:hypothetical protein
MLSSRHPRVRAAVRYQGQGAPAHDLTVDPGDKAVVGQVGGVPEGGEDGDGQQPTGKAGERFKVACGCQPPRSFWIRAKQYAPGPITCGVCGQRFQPRTPATSSKVESHPARRGQAAAWKRTRAWSARTATRSGPSTAGSWRSMLGSRRAATTGTPWVTTLPQGT